MARRTENGARQPVLERTAADAYRAIQAELDGREDDGRTVGAFHDLEAAFQRVTTAYFAGAMAKPRLVWSRRITGCKFGHYDPLRDELMVSATLDSREVPSYVVDFVVYHELLHKKHGAKWQNGRQAVHTSAFRGMSAASLNTRPRKKRSSNSPSGWRLDPVLRVKLRIQPTHVDRLRGGQEVFDKPQCGAHSRVHTLPLRPTAPCVVGIASSRNQMSKRMREKNRGR
jgi:hypothetical protein